MEEEAFDKHLAESYPDVRPTGEDAEFARQNWRAALGWVKAQEDSLFKRYRYEEQIYPELMKIINQELGEQI